MGKPRTFGVKKELKNKISTETYDLVIKLVQNSTRISRDTRLQFDPEDLFSIDPLWYSDLIETMKKQIDKQADGENPELMEKIK